MEKEKQDDFDGRMEKQTLDFYALVVVSLGIWMAFSPYSGTNFVTIVQDIYSPLWILSTIFISGGVLNMLVQNRYFWLYIFFVSTPLVFFGLVFLQVSIISSVFAPTVILAIAIGLYSAIRAGQIFQKRKRNKIGRV
jgi:hypothetical protein